ncbi:MAG: aminotransferase class V-fold PLP-dependent enzyme [Eubacteriales bacterium]|nr:aminotransferase class V-fold PLP-dependent enzyme [Eubacteriales bacterium]
MDTKFENVYLDNAATTMHKPDCVIEAVVNAMRTMGNAGRTSNKGAMDSGRIIFDTRLKLAQLFNADGPAQVVFTKNSTEALNIAIKGLFNKGDHLISTVMEHNSVLRPIYAIEKEQEVSHTFIGTDKKGRLLIDDIEKNIKSNTKALIVTHASNLSGNVNDLYTIGEIAKKNELLFIVDASQTAGAYPIDMKKMNIDVLCWTGHKGLFGPQGTGGLCVRKGVDIRPFTQGGTGVQSYLEEQPAEMPVRLEAGTLNAHGIAGLNAAITFIHDTGIDNIHKREICLLNRFRDGLKSLDMVSFYGDYDTDERTAIAAINIADYDSGEVSDELEHRFGISTRPGAHCAPLMHKAFGTVEQGIVRFSFSYFNTEDEVDYAIEAIRKLCLE